MSFGPKPQAYQPPPIPEPPPAAPSYGSDKQKAMGAKYGASQTGGVGSTILTSGQGLLQPAFTAKKSLLGQ